MANEPPSENNGSPNRPGMSRNGYQNSRERAAANQERPDRVLPEIRTSPDSCVPNTADFQYCNDEHHAHNNDDDTLDSVTDFSTFQADATDYYSQSPGAETDTVLDIEMSELMQLVSTDSSSDSEVDQTIIQRHQDVYTPLQSSQFFYSSSEDESSSLPNDQPLPHMCSDSYVVASERVPYEDASKFEVFSAPAVCVTTTNLEVNKRLAVQDVVTPLGIAEDLNIIRPQVVCPSYTFHGTDYEPATATERNVSREGTFSFHKRETSSERCQSQASVWRSLIRDEFIDKTQEVGNDSQQNELCPPSKIVSTSFDVFYAEPRFLSPDLQEYSTVSSHLTMDEVESERRLSQISRSSKASKDDQFTEEIRSIDDSTLTPMDDENDSKSLDEFLLIINDSHHNGDLSINDIVSFDETIGGEDRMSNASTTNDVSFMGDYISSNDSIVRAYQIESDLRDEMRKLERNLRKLHNIQSVLRREMTYNSAMRHRKRQRPLAKVDRANPRYAKRSGSIFYIPDDSGSDEEDCDKCTKNKRTRETMSLPVVNIDEEEKGEPPRVISHLKNLVIPSGYRAKLSCTILGEPYPEIRWTKNGKPLPPKHRQCANSNFDFGLCSYEIYSARTEDSGEYCVTATNSHGVDSSSCFLQVSGERESTPSAPSIATRASEVEVEEGSKAVLEWTVDGFPEPEVIIKKDGTKIRSELDRDVLVSRKGVSRVTFQRAKRKHAGSYTLVAENDVGAEALTIDLRVRPKNSAARKQGSTASDEVMECGSNSDTPLRRDFDDVERSSFATNFGYDLDDDDDDDPMWFKTHGIPYFRQIQKGAKELPDLRRLPWVPLSPYFTEISRTSATLCWTKPINDGGSRIIEYVVEGREVATRQWREKGTSRFAIFTIYSLKPNTTYVFRVSAKNKYGTGQAVITEPITTPA